MGECAVLYTAAIELVYWTTRASVFPGGREEIVNVSDNVQPFSPACIPYKDLGRRRLASTMLNA
jgi:hypothetical protein